MDQTIVSNQRIVIIRLQEYCNYTPRLAEYYHNNQADFMQDRLEAMVPAVMELKKTILSNACADFMTALKKIQSVETKSCEDLLHTFDKFAETHESLLHVLDNFVYSKDFREIKNMMPHSHAERLGDKILLHQDEKEFEHHKLQILQDRFLRLEPISLVKEEKKSRQERDPETEKRISYTYNRLGLAAHEKVFTERLKEWSGTCRGKPPEENEKTRDCVLSRFWDDVLPAIRKEVGDYCCQFQIPANKNGDGTLTPFMLSRVEILIPANNRFFNRVRSILHYLMPV